MTRSLPRPSPPSFRPRTIAAGIPSILPMTSWAAPAISSAIAISRRVQLVPHGVAFALEIAERDDPGDTERDVRRSAPPGAAERVRDDHADIDAGQLANAVAQALGRSVRIDRKQDERVRPLGIRGVDTGGRADESVLRLRDHERRARADDLSALAQDHLDSARILIGSELARSGDGSTSARSTTRPSTFETAFWATTTTSSGSNPPARAPQRREAPRDRRLPRAPGCRGAG